METQIKPKPESRLTVADRCDRCGAQAYVIFAIGTGEIQMCKHHSDEHAPALTAKGGTIVDDIRSTL